MSKFVSAHFVCGSLPHQMNSRQKVEASLRQLERERALLQQQSGESLRKAEIEVDRKRILENECEHLMTSQGFIEHKKPYYVKKVLDRYFYTCIIYSSREEL